MKKVLKLFLLAGVATTLAACDTTEEPATVSSETPSVSVSESVSEEESSSVAQVESSSEAVVESSSEAVVESSSEAVVESSSEASVESSSETSVESSSEEAVSSSDSVSEDTSSEEAVAPVAHEINLTTLAEVADDKGVPSSDGYFTTFGTTPDGTTRLKSDGTSTYGSDADANHIVVFTTDGAGEVTGQIRSGSSDKLRYAYLVEFLDGKINKNVEVVNWFSTSLSNSSAPVLSDWVIPKAGMYGILTSEGMNIYNLTVTTTAGSVAENPFVAPTAGDFANELNGQNLMLGRYTATNTCDYGNYFIAADVTFRSPRTLPAGITPNGAFTGTVYVDLSDGGNITLHAESAGTLTVYATGDGTTSTLAFGGTADATVLGADSAKATTAINYTVAAAGDVVITGGVEAADCYVYYATFTPAPSL